MESVFSDMQKSIKSAKESIVSKIEQLRENDSKQQELSMKQITSSNSKPSENQKLLSKSDQISQAIRNSSIARLIYHSQQPEALFEECLKKQEVMEQLDKDVMASTSNCSKILDLSPDAEETKLSENNAEDKILEGVLQKESPSMFGGWSLRYCRLSHSEFIYHQGAEASTPRAGILNFDLLPFRVETLKEQGHLTAFSIKLKKGGPSSEKTQEWSEQIQDRVNNCSGKYLQKSQLSQYHRFWRKNYISQKQFRNIAHTGDILLFRGKKPSSIMQRKVTRDQYDHIGVLLENTFGQLLVFEANGGFGVGLCPWKKFIKNKWYQDQDIVVLRQLDINRTEGFLSAVSQFVQENLGKGYKFSLTSFLTSRHSSPEHQNNTYFCSSLVAKLYKVLGLLDEKKSSNRYFPSDFAEKQNLQLQSSKFHGKAALGEEKIIVFEQLLVDRTQPQ